MRRAIARHRAGWYRRVTRGRWSGSVLGSPSVAGLLGGLQPWHHGPQLRPDLLDQLAFGALAGGVEGGPARLVFQDPGAREGAVLDLTEDLAHLLADGGADDPWAADVVAELGGVADAVPHIAHAALVHQIDDQLHLVEALEVGELRLVAGLHHGGEAGLDQRGQSTAEDRLLAEKVRFGLLFERRLQHPRHR